MTEAGVRQGDTIAALSSGAVPSGVAVIRVSGPEARRCVEELTGRPPPEPGSVSLRTFKQEDEPIDHGLVLWFEGPHSFTGEDVAEFQSHGGRAVVDGLLQALTAIDGIRYAEAGEFSKQAFLNGRLDLTSVEGLSDLIQAETEFQRRQAFSQMKGALAELYETWRSKLIRALAHVEADIDFSDEDLPDDLSDKVSPVVRSLLNAVRGHLEGGHLGERLRDGFRVAIYGPPNVGKSSLLNLMAQRDVAIVSDLPGTTRDFLEVHLNLGGVPVTVVDTAGLRETQDAVERIGVQRAGDQVSSADIRVWVVAATDPKMPEGQGQTPDVVVINKVDLAEPDVERLDGMPKDAICLISVKEGTGVGGILSVLDRQLKEKLQAKPEVVPTRLRHRESLDRCAGALERVLETPLMDSDILAEELRVAMTALGEITGRAGVEDMLDVVFRDFCIGK